LLTTYEQEFWQDNFYNAWLSALMTLDEDTTSETHPPVMRTRTWQHRMLNAQLARKSHHFVSGSRRDSILQGYSATERILVVFVREAKAL